MSYMISGTDFLCEKGMFCVTVREQIESREKILLAPYATHSADTAGRERAEEPCPLRTDYQRDRDRIIHSKAFRRLKQKTQVFLSPEGDHYRTRLTHTLEVTQIGRTVARALALNEDLTEAIGLGHDLGHTPFGHAGERALAKLCPAGFTHYGQSVRVVQRLERELRGLNLTAEVLDGIRNHTKGPWAATPEGQVLRWADRIAYINHDIEDAIEGNVLRQSDLPAVCVQVLGESKSERISTLIADLVAHSLPVLESGAVAAKGQVIDFSPAVREAFDKLHDFMYASVYLDSAAKAEEYKVEGLVSQLYAYYQRNPDKLPPMYQTIAWEEGLERAVTDYISGMSDEYAVRVFDDLFIPQKWHIL